MDGERETQADLTARSVAALRREFGENVLGVETFRNQTSVSLDRAALVLDSPLNGVDAVAHLDGGVFDTGCGTRGRGASSRRERGFAASGGASGCSAIVKVLLLGFRYSV